MAIHFLRRMESFIRALRRKLEVRKHETHIRRLLRRRKHFASVLNSSLPSIKHGGTHTSREVGSEHELA
jgi:hypothetical protein